MKKLFILAIAATAMVSCSQSSTTTTDAPFNLDSAKAAVVAANTYFTEAISKNDSVAAASIYAKDATMLMASMPNIVGRDAITSFIGGGKRMGIGTIKLNVVEVLGSKELLSEEGTYEIVDAAGASMDKGKYLAIWKLKTENGRSTVI